MQLDRKSIPMALRQMSFIEMGDPKTEVGTVNQRAFVFELIGIGALLVVIADTSAEDAEVVTRSGWTGYRPE